VRFVLLAAPAGYGEAAAVAGSTLTARARGR